MLIIDSNDVQFIVTSAFCQSNSSKHKLTKKEKGKDEQMLPRIHTRKQLSFACLQVTISTCTGRLHRVGASRGFLGSICSFILWSVGRACYLCFGKREGREKKRACLIFIQLLTKYSNLINKHGKAR